MSQRFTYCTSCGEEIELGGDLGTGRSCPDCGEPLSPDDLGSLDRDELRDLYMESIQHLKYATDNVWRGQKYYTTLNTAIFGGAIGLGRLEVVGGPLDVWMLPIFVIGAFTSLLGWKSITSLRRYFLQSRLKKIGLEHLLGYRRSFSRGGEIETDLAISWKMLPSSSRIQGDVRGFDDLRFDAIREAFSEDWIEDNIHKRGSVTYWFVTLHRLFFILHISLIISIFLKIS